MHQRFDDLKESIDFDGFAFIQACEPKVPTEKLLSLIANLEDYSNEGPVHTLTPKCAQTSKRNTYSGVFGLDAFPLHTDLAHWQVPPRYFALRCISGSKYVETKLLDSRILISQFGVNCLENEIVMPRKKIRGMNRAFSIFEQSKNIFRWDEVFLKPCLRASRFEEIAKCISIMPTRNIKLSEYGDLLLVDNWRMLHGRGNVTQAGLSRVIDRVYIRELLCQIQNQA